MQSHPAWFAMNDSKALLELENVSIVRGTTRILDRLSLRVDRNEHCVILGPNGSGKSTLLKLLTRTMYPSIVDGRAGVVRILGQTEWNVWDLRTQLGIVSSELDHHFTTGRSGRLPAADVVLTGFFASELEPDAERVTSEMKDAANDALETFGMMELRDRPVAHLSTGERRRVMLARAMVRKPFALILDEPTAGLDVRAQRDLLQQLDRVAESGTSIVLVTHHLSEIMPCMSRTLCMQKGRIYFDGKTTDALNPSHLAGLFECEMELF
jgi:iron complex transport system ATP-binding protein